MQRKKTISAERNGFRLDTMQMPKYIIKGPSFGMKAQFGKNF